MQLYLKYVDGNLQDAFNFIAVRQIHDTVLSKISEYVDETPQDAFNFIVVRQIHDTVLNKIFSTVDYTKRVQPKNYVLLVLV